MSKCCDPIEIKPNCVNTCNQLINSCCVINEAGLPCIIPPVTIIDASTVIGTTSITDSGIFTDLPNPFYGTIEVTDSSGSIAADTIVTRISGGTAFLSTTILRSGKTDITFTFVEQRQCDINAAIDSKICNLESCPSWTALPPNSGGGWVSTSGGALGAEYSNITNCTVKLRGSIGTLSYLSTEATLGILPVGYRPKITYNRLYAVPILVNGTTLKVAIVNIEASMGLVIVVDSTLIDGDAVIVYLDGIFFEVSPN